MTRAIGEAFEQRARRELERAGLTLIAANYTTRHGEIDLVMREGGSIVFVEVRYRVRPGQGSALASVTPSKQAKLIRAASLWLAEHPRQAKLPCRFDVVSYDGPAEDAQMAWERGAFEIT